MLHSAGKINADEALVCQLFCNKNGQERVEKSEQSMTDNQQIAFPMTLGVSHLTAYFSIVFLWPLC